MTQAELNAFLQKAYDAAVAAGHRDPKYAACEAALESDWGRSDLARKANNLFGQKEGFSSREFPVIDISTNEILHGVSVHEKHCYWPVFPDWVTCFRERMELLQRLPAYKPALDAPDGETFVRAVSRVWATDPERANKVLVIYRNHAAHFGNAVAVTQS